MKIPEEGRRTYRPKRCGNNNKDEDNSLKTPNDKDTRVLLFLSRTLFDQMNIIKY